MNFALPKPREFDALIATSHRSFTKFCKNRLFSDFSRFSTTTFSACFMGQYEISNFSLDKLVPDHVILTFVLSEVSTFKTAGGFGQAFAEIKKEKLNQVKKKLKTLATKISSSTTFL